MISNAAFIIREGSGGLRRSPLHSFIAVAGSASAVFILGLYIYSAVNLQRAANKLLGNLEVQAFVALSLPDSAHTVLQDRLQRMDARWKIRYISRHQAAVKFAQGFDPDLFNVLKENPLPASFLIRLSASQMHPDSIKSVAERLTAVNGIEEVIYDKELLELLDAAQRRLVLWGTGLAFLALFLAVGLTFNAIRLKIQSQREAVDLMYLLGATPFSLRVIFWVQGGVLGILGGLVGCAFIYGAALVLNWQLVGELTVVLPYAYLLIAIGGVLGACSGMLAAQRYLKP